VKLPDTKQSLISSGTDSLESGVAPAGSLAKGGAHERNEGTCGSTSQSGISAIVPRA
jgi:hypothetical protein